MELRIDRFKPIFLNELDKVLLPSGYKYIKSRTSYVIKNRNNWELEVTLDCLKWSSHISIQTKASALDRSLTKILQKIIGRDVELLYWGVLPTISRFLDLNGSEPKQWLEVRSEDEIVPVAEKWIDDFEHIIIPFFDRITTDPKFALEIVEQFPDSFFFPDYARCLPMLCALQDMYKTDISRKCNQLVDENKHYFTSYRAINQINAEFEKWTKEYYEIKDFVLEK